LVTHGFAKTKSCADQSGAYAFSTDLIRGDEPPQVSPFPVGVHPIDRYRSMYLTIVDGKPKPVTLIIAPNAELSQLSRDLGFKWQTEANQFGVVPGVQLANPPDTSWYIAGLKRHAHWAGLPRLSAVRRNPCGRVGRLIDRQDHFPLSPFL
jgi:hypothetical protein